MTVFYLNKCSLFLWWQIWIFSSRYSRLQRHITSFIFLSHFQVPTCSRDSGHHQVPAYGARSALWSPHYGKQREPRYCCQLHTVIYHFICLLGKTDPLYYCFVCRLPYEYYIIFFMWFLKRIGLLCYWCASVCLRVIIHIVSQCHEEGLEHYLRMFLKVQH